MADREVTLEEFEEAHPDSPKIEWWRNLLQAWERKRLLEPELDRPVIMVSIVQTPMGTLEGFFFRWPHGKGLDPEMELILGLSHKGAGGQEPHFAPIDINNILRDRKVRLN